MRRTPSLPQIWNHGITRALVVFGFYSIWSVVFRLLVLSCITYLLTSSAAHPLHFQDINESYGGSELSVMGISSLLFVMLMKWLHPLTSTTGAEIFTAKRLEREFLPGFLHGSILASGIVLILVFSGIYRYLGFFIQYEEAPLALANVVWRIVAIGLFAYSEEFIFRRKILGHLSYELSPALSIVATTLLYCATKAIQFDLGRMQMLSLFALSIALSIRAVTENDFCRGAGFWAAVLVVFHPLASLPVFGDDFSGLLLVKYQGLSDSIAGSTAGFGDAAARFLAGGAGGPLSSIAFQIVIALDILRGLLQNKKTLLKPAGKPI